jgi:hypothetical protein
VRSLVQGKVDQTSVLVLQAEWFPHISYLDTYPFQPTRADAALSETNLLILLHSMVNSTDRKVIAARRSKLSNDKLHLTQLPYPAHAIYTNDRSSMLVAAGVVRGFSAPMRYCELELHAVSGSACLELSRRGLDRTDCVVPGIGMAGRNVQFFATYLLSGTFPVMVALTPELCLTGTTREQMEIATWCVRVADFAVQTTRLLRTAHSTSPLSRARVVLNMRQYFAKPLSDDCLAVAVANAADVRPDYTTACVRLQRIMEFYQRLHEAALSSANESDRDLVLFPEGVVTVPGPHASGGSDGIKNLLIRTCQEAGFRVRDYDCRPVMLFPRLSPNDGWTTRKPSPDLVAAYVQHLRRAVHLLNRAGVAHLDLHPRNIMWRCVDPNIPAIEMRLVDFEDARLFGTIIPNRYVSLCDRRYPFSQEQRQVAYRCERAAEAAASTATDRAQFLRLREPPTQHIIACAHHNDFFLEAVAKWVQSSTTNFDDYMSAPDTAPSQQQTGIERDVQGLRWTAPDNTVAPRHAADPTGAPVHRSPGTRGRFPYPATAMHLETEAMIEPRLPPAQDRTRPPPVILMHRSSRSTHRVQAQPAHPPIGAAVGGGCASSAAARPPPASQLQHRSRFQALGLLPAGAAVSALDANRSWSSGHRRSHT